MKADKKTLMFYINAIHDGGAERVIIQLAYNFAIAGYHTVLVTSFVDQNEYPVPENVERVSIEQHEVVQSRFKRNFSRILALRRLCKKYKPVALISFMVEPCFRALIATIGLSVKNIVSVRNDPNRDYSGIIGKFVGKVIMPIADGCVFQTKDAKAWFPKKLQKKSRIIMNAVDHTFFEQKRSEGGTSIVSLGRLTRQKNQKMLIRAFSKVAANHPDITLNIYGIGPLNEDLQKLIADNSMQSRISLKGLTSNSQSVLANAALFILSSDYEGMPNALMEALAVGVPCISTDCPCGGPRMLITDKENGLLIPVGDEVALANAIDFMLTDRQSAERMGAYAKQRAKEYETTVVFQQWKTFVESVVA